MSKVMVSISCITYNHEKYISDAIESFLMQKTNFDFEILIHDDASTDRTAEIIREYEKKYPDKIRPIYQIDNQYSKGVDVERINNKRAKGKYIALCEGDDYWTDPNKLQKQVNYMEKHPECSLCVHAGYFVSASREEKSPYRPNNYNKIFTVEEVIEGGGGLFMTNSMLYPTKFSQNRPSFLENAPVGDYPLAINLSLQGIVYYMADFMSAYRVGVAGSWTDLQKSNDTNNKIKFNEELIAMLDEIDQHTNYQYKDVIARTKKFNQFNLLVVLRNFKEAKTGDTKEIYLKLGYKRKVIIHINQYYPILFKILQVVKRKLIRWRVK